MQRHLGGNTSNPSGQVHEFKVDNQVIVSLT